MHNSTNIYAEKGLLMKIKGSMYNNYHQHYYITWY